MFWGAQVQFDKKFVPEKEDYAYLHLRNVSLLWAKEKISVICTIKQQNETEDETDFVLCHLDENNNKSAKINLYFDLTNQDITFSVIGKGKVSLVGSLEAKEGKALTNELVKNLAPKIADAKMKMILDLAKLAKSMKKKEGDADEDLDDEEEYVEGMDLESDEEEEDDQEEDDEEEEEEEEEKPSKNDNKLKQVQQVSDTKKVSKTIQKQDKHNKSAQQQQKQQQKPSQQQKQVKNEKQNKAPQQNQKDSQKQRFNLSNSNKAKKEVEVEIDEFAAI